MTRTAAWALALAVGATLPACRDGREQAVQEVAELERKERETPAGQLRDQRKETAEAIDDLHEGQERGGPIAGTDVVRGTVRSVTPEAVRLDVGARVLELGLPADAQIQAANGHELGREYVVPGAEVRAVYHGAGTASPEIDELWVDRVPGQERLPTNDPMGPALPTPPADEDRSPPSVPDPGGRVR